MPGPGRGRLVSLGVLALLFASVLVVSPSGSASSSASPTCGKSVKPPCLPKLGLTKGGPWKGYVRVEQITNRMTAGGTGMVTTSHLAWSSSSVASWTRGQLLVTLKGSGSFSAIAKGKIVGDCPPGDAEISVSEAGKVSPSGELVFSITLKDPLRPAAGLRGALISTPAAHWTGKQKHTPCDPAESDYGDMFYSSTFVTGAQQGGEPIGTSRVIADAKGFVWAGGGSSKIPLGKQTVKWKLTCTDPYACFSLKRPPVSTVPPDPNTNPTREEATRTTFKFLCKSYTTSGNTPQVEISGSADPLVYRMPKKPGGINVADPYTIYQTIRVEIQRQDKYGVWKAWTSKPYTGFGYTTNANTHPSKNPVAIPAASYLAGIGTAAAADIRIKAYVKVKYRTKVGSDATIWEYESTSGTFDCPASGTGGGFAGLPSTP